MYDSEKTQEFLKTLPQSATGMVLKRKFSKEEGEEYYSDFIYSAWINCVKEEVGGEVEYELNLEFNPIMFDWEGNKKDIKKDSTIKLTSTPIFLLKSSFLKYELYLILFVLVAMF